MGRLPRVWIGRQGKRLGLGGGRDDGYSKHMYNRYRETNNVSHILCICHGMQILLVARDKMLVSRLQIFLLGILTPSPCSRSYAKRSLTDARYERQ